MDSQTKIIPISQHESLNNIILQNIILEEYQQITIISDQMAEIVMPLAHNIDSWDVKNLQIKNSQLKLFAPLENIKFDFLIGLSLYDNKIESIESLAKLKAHNLQWLFLGDNRISQLRPIIKVASNKLNTINFRNNIIRQISAMEYLNTSFIRFLGVEVGMGDKKQVQSLQIACKFPFGDNFNIEALSNKRILEPNLYLSLIRKGCNTKVDIVTKKQAFE